MQRLSRMGSFSAGEYIYIYRKEPLSAGTNGTYNQNGIGSWACFPLMTVPPICQPQALLVRHGKNKLHELRGFKFVLLLFSPFLKKNSSKFGFLNVQTRNNFNVIFIACK